MATVAAAVAATAAVVAEDAHAGYAHAGYAHAGYAHAGYAHVGYAHEKTNGENLAGRACEQFAPRWIAMAGGRAAGASAVCAGMVDTSGMMEEKAAEAAQVVTQLAVELARVKYWVAAASVKVAAAMVRSTASRRRGKCAILCQG